MVILDRLLTKGNKKTIMICDLIIWMLSTSVFFRYVREFGFTIPNRQILIDDIRVRGTGHSKTTVEHEVPKATIPPPVKKVL